MNIIFGIARDQLPDHYTVVELDTFRTVTGARHTAYCVLENIPMHELPHMQHWLKIHHDLLLNYRAREWNYCERAIEALMGRWNHELDSFYSDLLSRVQDLKIHAPDQSWDGSILKI